MCLYTNSNKVNKVETKPVKCVKVVKRYIMKDGTSRYFSLFCGGACNVQPVEYKPGEITDMYDIIDNIETGTIHTPYPESYKLSICSSISINASYNPEKFEVKAGLHSYDPNHNGWKEAALWADEYFSKKHEDIMGDTVGKGSIWYNVGIAIIECEIPAGASYIIGRHNAVSGNDEIGYVSDKLKTIRVFESIEEYETLKKI